MSSNTNTYLKNKTLLTLSDPIPSRTSLSQSQIQSTTVYKFLLYIKKTSHFYNQLESYKRQLAKYINSINYTLPFAILDIQRKGIISQKNIQLFLINNKYYVKPADINRYYHKYRHGKDALTYNDIMEALIPHADYILMSATTKKIIENQHLQKYPFNYLHTQPCHQYLQKSYLYISSMIALIIHTEIQYLKQSFMMLSDITNNSNRVGNILWRCLDRYHDNLVNYDRLVQITNKYGCGIEISEFEWKAFINWQFRSHKIKYEMNRYDFMTIIDAHIVNKRNGSALSRFVQKEVMNKVSKVQRQTDNNIENFVERRISRIQASKTISDTNNDKSQLRLNKSMSMSLNSKNKKSTINNQYINKSIISSTANHNFTSKHKYLRKTNAQINESNIINPQNSCHTKTLLYSKLGYKNPSQFIKMSQIIL